MGPVDVGSRREAGLHAAARVGPEGELLNWQGHAPGDPNGEGAVHKNRRPRSEGTVEANVISRGARRRRSRPSGCGRSRSALSVSIEATSTTTDGRGRRGSAPVTWISTEKRANRPRTLLTIRCRITNRHVGVDRVDDPGPGDVTADVGNLCGRARRGHSGLSSRSMVIGMVIYGDLVPHGNYGPV